MSEAPQSASPKTADEMEKEAYLSIPTLERQVTFWSLILAAVAMGIGAGSFWIGVGTFLSLLFVSSSLGMTMTKHRYLTKPNT
ncbi:hypothetical protein [Pseudomonas viridiflava]